VRSPVTLTTAELGPKWVPTFVSPAAEIPKLSSMGGDQRTLRAAAWRAEGTWWRPDRAGRLRPLDSGDRARLDPLLDRAAGPPAG
jgi:hypothetical protein